MAKQVLEIEAKAGKFRKCVSDEQLRNWSEKKFEEAQKRGNYDPSRTHLNFEIKKGGLVTVVDKKKSIPQRIKEILKSRGIVDPNDRPLKRPDMHKPGQKRKEYITHANILFYGNQERMREIAFGDEKIDYERYSTNHLVLRKPEIEQWALDMYNFVAKKWGEENIAAFIVHLDELNPHIHCTLLTVSEKKKGCYRDYFGSRRDSKIPEIHDELAEVNKKWGLERGDDRRATGAVHRSNKEYKRSVDALGKKAAWLETEGKRIGEERMSRVDERQRGMLSLGQAIRSLSTSADELRDILSRDDVTIDDIASALRIANRRVGGLKTMLKNLRKKEEELRAQGGGNGEKKELEKIDSDIRDKEEKLGKAEMQLNLLLEKKAELERRVEKGEQKVLNINKRRVQTNLGFAGSIALSFIATVVNNTQKSHGIFDESKAEWGNNEDSDDHIPYEGFVDHSDDIMDCAVLIFSGMIQSALTKSEICGGGLGSGALPKKKDEEDEREFARRCLAASARGFVPTAKKGRRR